MKNTSNSVKKLLLNATLMLFAVALFQTNADAQSTKLKGHKHAVMIKDKSAKGINENKTQAKSSKKTPKDNAGDPDVANEVKYKRNTLPQKK